jgi:hypothetical protein
MSMRVRRLGLLGLVFLTGASLLRSSMALTGPAAHADPTVNLSLSGSSKEAPKSRTDVWAVEVPTTGDTGARSGTLQLPDGTLGLTLSVKVGRHAYVTVLTNALTPLDLFDALGVTVNKLDKVRPSRKAVLWTGMRLRLIRTNRVVLTFDENDPFGTLIQYSSDLPEGQSEILRAGVPGEALRTYRITYRNGREVARVQLKEATISAPIDEILLQGTGGQVHGTQSGQASWYDFCKIDGNYAAHLTLPFGTVVTVTNVDNGESVTVVINDRGPYGVPGRIIDLCDSAFAQIAPLSQGVADVTLTW